MFNIGDRVWINDDSLYEESGIIVGRLSGVSPTNKFYLLELRGDCDVLIPGIRIYNERSLVLIEKTRS